MQRQTNVYNDGRAPIRVIMDSDNVNDSTLERGEEREIETRDTAPALAQ
ncbi:MULTISPECIES: hypothetical protein [unclassified Paraburkholderia]|nr:MULTISPECIES: hypothetical protein [unclassified Paraburkholderia]